MAKMGKSMSMASRLAAATALTGTLAACDGRFGRATDALFAPMSTETPTDLAEKSAPPAAPGNPVYIEGSKAANDAAYQQAYGAPIQGSGQAIAPQPTYAGSVYQDSTITATPITDIPGGPVIDAGAPAPAYTVQSVGYSEPVAIQPQYSAPVPVQPQYSPPISAPASPSFPAIGTEPVYVPQSSLPARQSLPTTVFTDASAMGDARDIEPLLDAAPMENVPYGSSASHRYTVAEQPLQSLAALPEYTPPQYSLPVTMIEETAAATDFATAAPIETVDVAALGGGFMPMPRARPERIGPVFEAAQVVEAAPVPKIRPSSLRISPLPVRRPVQLAALSGRAITDAPALTEPPKMIEVEAIFIDEPTPKAPQEPTVETAALTPADAPNPVVYTAPKKQPQEPESDALEISVIKPEELEREMAAFDASKVTIDTSESLALAPKPTKVEIADDIGDLKELSGTSWRLSELDGKEVPATAELHFDGGSGFAGGQAFCNNYGGEFSESLKGEFGMANIFSTETECDHFSLEKQYITALEAADKYRMAPGLNELMLIGPGGKTIATFAAF